MAQFSWIRLIGFVALMLTGLGTETFAQTTDELLANLKSPIPKTRRDAARELGERRQKAGSRTLQEVVASDKTAEVRSAAIHALGRIKDMDALPVMLATLRDSDVDVRRETILALVMLYTEKDIDFILARRSGIRLLDPFLSTYESTVLDPVVTVDPRIPDGLVGLVGQDPDEVSIPAIRALGVLRAGQTVDALGRKLASAGGLRVEILRTFIKMGEPSAGRYVIAYLNDNDTRVRNQAHTAAGVLKTKDAVPELLRIFRSNADENTRKLSLEALARIADPKTEEVMIAALASPSAGLRRFANEGLARLENAKRVEMISSYRLKEKDASVRLAQAFALYRLGRREYIQAVAADLASGRKDQASEYLLESRPEDLYPLLDTGPAEQRRRVAESLGKIGSAGAIPPLRRLLNASDSELVNAANLAIYRIEQRVAPKPQGEKQDTERQRRPKKVVPRVFGFASPIQADGLYVETPLIVKVLRTSVGGIFRGRPLTVAIS